jgi:hypothetical protein
MKHFKLLIVLLMWFGLSLTGFRTFTAKTRWDISKASPKIFVRFCANPTVTANDLPSGDPLHGQALNLDLIMTSIYNDFTSIPSSFVELVSSADPAFATSQNRTINVCVSNVAGAGGGFASQKLGANGKISSCDITLAPGTTDSASRFIATLTHEIGHCLGLDHAHETDQAIMSYFFDPNKPRLQMDDQMGLIHQFPDDPSYANESPSLGMSCAPK